MVELVLLDMIGGAALLLAREPIEVELTLGTRLDPMER
jgi:hypothetical protein